MFKIKDKQGKRQMICLGSAFPNPFNCCSTAGCTYCPKNQYGKPDNNKQRLRYLHVDLADAHWTTLPPDDWSEVIHFLQHPGVSEHIAPSPI